MGKTVAMLSPIVAVQLVYGCHQMSAIICFEAVVVLLAANILLTSVEIKGRNYMILLLSNILTYLILHVLMLSK